jgi:hypothetical protein
LTSSHVHRKQQNPHLQPTHRPQNTAVFTPLRSRVRSNC